MKARIKSAWLALSLAVLGVTLFAGNEAHAGGIGLKGFLTPLPGGSPFLYEYDAYLTGGSIAAGSTITISDMVGVTTQSGTQQPPTTGGPSDEIWIVPSGGIVTGSTGRPVPYDKV